jgi:hypothetical protein
MVRGRYAVLCSRPISCRMVEIIKQAELAYLSMSKLSELSQSARLVNQARPKSLLGSLNWLK